MSKNNHYHQKHLQKLVQRLFIILLAVFPAMLSLLPKEAALAQTDEPTARVIVVLRNPAAQRMQSQSEQPAFVDTSDPDTKVVHQYKHLPAVAIESTTENIEKLRLHPDVAAIVLDLPVSIAVTDTPAAFLQADIVQETLGITGKGVTVAVLDTGIDTTHPDLRSQIIAEQCFNKDEDCPPDKTAQGDSGQDENGHGTHVAGIIAGQGTESPLGIAPGANLAAIRVLSSQGTGYTSDVLAGIEWAIDHQAEFNIRIINMSLGGGSYDGVCDETDDTSQLYATVATAARDAGILLFAAAGNRGDAANLMVPACVSGVVAIGNGYHTSLPEMRWPTCTDSAVVPGQIACGSNSNSALTLLAPGTLIQSAALGGGQIIHSGTSMATPHAAAVASLMLEAGPSLTPVEIENNLTQTGMPTKDPRNGQPLVFIDALAAVQAIIVPTTPITLTGTILLQGRQDHSGTAIYTGDAGCTTVSAAEAPDAVTGVSGDFSLPGVVGQSIGCMWATKPGYLPARADYLPHSSITLPAGDVNQDQVINILDLAIIAQAYKTDTPLADIDGSGMVDILDLTWTGRNFNQQGPILWTD
jgi:serine protease AprX